MVAFFDVIGTILSFVWNTLGMIVDVFLMMFKGLTFLTQAVAALPLYFQVTATAIIGIAILFLIIGRG